MNIKDKLFISWNICLIAFILIFCYFYFSWHINRLCQIIEINGAINYAVNTKGYLSQEDVNYFLNRINEIETN